MYIIVEAKLISPDRKRQAEARERINMQNKFQAVKTETEDGERKELLEEQVFSKTAGFENWSDDRLKEEYEWLLEQQFKGARTADLEGKALQEQNLKSLEEELKSRGISAERIGQIRKQERSALTMLAEIFDSSVVDRLRVKSMKQQQDNMPFVIKQILGAA